MLTYNLMQKQMEDKEMPRNMGRITSMTFAAVVSMFSFVLSHRAPAQDRITTSGQHRLRTSRAASTTSPDNLGKGCAAGSLVLENIYQDNPASILEDCRFSGNKWAVFSAENGSYINGSARSELQLCEQTGGISRRLVLSNSTDGELVTVGITECVYKN